MMLWYIFFFQAEDGIRDIGVTGVQTCALPIWRERGGGLRRHSGRPGGEHRASTVLQAIGVNPYTPGGAEPDSAAYLTARSEERRVGKECRSRWSPYH